jgi:hypothetical protein
MEQPVQKTADWEIIPMRELPPEVRKRQQNEKKFGNWNETPSGGRRYWHEVQGRSHWRARYVKEVDEGEATLRFYQEILDGSGVLREIHHKYPVD